MSNRKKILLGVISIAVIAVAYLGVRLIGLRADMLEANKNIASIQAAASKSDFKGIGKNLSKLAENAVSIQSATQDPLLAPLAITPVIGSDFVALQKVSISLTDLATTAQPLVRYGAQLQEQGSNATTAGFDAKAVHAFRDAFVAFAAALDKADSSFGSIKPSDLHIPLGEKLPSYQNTLHTANVSFKNLKPLVQLFSAVLANSQPKQRWYVATQNLAEARGTGGLFGSYAILGVNQGRVSLQDAGSDQKLLSAGSADFSAMPQEIRDLWGIDPKLWLDFNVSAHVPFTGQIIHDTWKKNFRQSIDGVIFIGQGTVAKLTAVTGPITVQGKTLDASNVADYLAKGVYADFGAVSQKNRFVAEFMQKLFKRLTSSQPDLKALFKEAADETSGDKVYAWSAYPDDQLDIVNQGIGGAVSDSSGSNVWFSVNNAGGNKLDAYLHLAAKYSLGKCGVLTGNGIPGRKGHLVMTLRNAAPKSGLPPYVSGRLDLPPGWPYQKGTSRILVSVYAPVGATSNGFTLNGKQTGALFGFDRKHSLFVFDLQLAPGETQKLVVNWLEPVNDLDGKSVQTVPTLTAPDTFNPVNTSVASSGFCPAN